LAITLCKDEFFLLWNLIFFLLRKNKNIMEFDVVVVFIVVGDEDWRCF